MSIRQTIATKIHDFIAGKKSASNPISFQVDGKTYFSVTAASELLSLLGKTERGDYSDQDLVRLYYSIAEIYAPISEIATAVSSGKFQVKRQKDDEVVYDNKYLNKLLSKPNPLQSWQEFMFESVVWLYVNGRNYVYANTPDTLSVNYRNISTLTNLYSYAVEPVHDVRLKLWSATEISDIIKGYRLNDGTPLVAPEKVMLSQFMSLNDGDKKIKGKSPLLSAKVAIRNLEGVYDARGAIYDSRGALGMLTSEVSDAGGYVALTPDEKDQVQKDYHERHGITGGKSPIAITGFPMKYQKIGMSIAELLPFEETQADASAIYGVLKVPQDLMPTPKGATFENQKQARIALYSNVAIPLAQQYAQSLTSFLKLEEMGLYIDVTFDHIEVLQADKKEKAEVSKIDNERLMLQFTHGVITLNDWIAQTGGEAVENELYNKRIMEMTPEQAAFVLNIIHSNGSKPADNTPAK